MSLDFSKDILVLNFVFGARPIESGGFTRLATVVDDQPTAARSILLRDASEAEDAFSAGTITAGARDRAIAAFSQAPRLGEYVLINRDAAGGEAIAEALNDPETLDFYGLTIESRAAADVVEAGTWANANERLFVAQSSDAEFLTAGVPAAYAAVGSLDAVAVLYHDRDDQPADVAWAASRLVFDADTQTASWKGPIRGVLPYSSRLSGAEVAFALMNNVNLVGEFSTAAPTYVGRGVSITGRQIHQVVSLHWLKRRIQDDLNSLQLKYDSLGLILPVSLEGHSIVRSVVQARGEEAQTLGKVVPTQFLTYDARPSDINVAAEALTVRAGAQIVTGTSVIAINFVFTSDPVISEEQ